MKIFLIDPPFYRFIKYFNRFFPLGLAYLAAVMREKGHEVVVYDADANVDKAEEMDFSALEEKYPEYIRQINDLSHRIWEEMKSVIAAARPDLVGINAYTTRVAAAFRTAEIVKGLFPGVPVVIGGPHPSVKAEESLRISPFVDFAIRGEGERSFSELAEAIERKGGFSGIKGLSYRSGGRIIHNPPVEFINDLDRIPYPARDLLINKGYYTSEDMGLIMTGRGCPYACTFCSSSGVWKRGVRARSIENVLGEIRKVQTEYGTVQFSFKDDTFTLDRKRVQEFCGAVNDERLNINWDCNVRVNLIDDELLRQMKAAGCNGIKMGIESGSDRVLNDVMKKGATVARILRAAEIARRASIHWTGYFMMGLPTETREEMIETLRLMRRIKPDFASLSVYEPFPGTDLFNAGVAAGCVTDERTLEDYYSISPKYYFMKNQFNRIDTMSDAEFREIERFIKESFRKYNRSLPRIFKRGKARSALYLKEPAALWGDFQKFIAWVR
ncbi:MAG: radical SAM protein [Deltaproteobacteria bacterium]|nr:radical SAM protein [Deltaproteobacteria bacterium]